MKNNKIYYSIVIPHHNTPELLKRLISTIPKRDDIEVIVVDDNSEQDKKAYAFRDDMQVYYIDAKSTKGPGKARNEGMKHVSGKWLLFADADDVFASNFLDVLDSYKDDDIDILFFNIDSADCRTLKKCAIQRAKPHRDIVSNYNKSEEDKNLLLYGRYAPWRKMLNNDYVKKYGFQFGEIMLGEDIEFSVANSFFAKNWKVDKRDVYIVTFNEQSISYSKYTPLKVRTIIRVFLQKEKFYKYLGHDKWAKNKKGCISLTITQTKILHILKRSPLMGGYAILYYIAAKLLRLIDESYLIDNLRLYEKNK